MIRGLNVVQCLLSYEGMKGLEAPVTMRGDAKPVFMNSKRVEFHMY